MFMNGWYGYDLQCEIVGEEGAVRLPDPANLIWRKNGFCGHEVFPSWSRRFESAYETEIREWARHAAMGRPCGPSAWDGYMASLAGELAVRSLRERRVVEFPDEKRPEFYDDGVAAAEPRIQPGKPGVFCVRETPPVGPATRLAGGGEP